MPDMSFTPFIFAFGIGIFYGWTSCTFICLPFLSLYIIGTDKGIARGLRTTMIFNAGRVLSYTVLGLLVGLIGQGIIGSTNQIVTSIAFSVVVVSIGLMMMFIEERRSCEAGHKRIDFLKRLPDNNALKAIILGISIALIPCAGLLTVFALSAVSFHPLTGALAGFLFGLGSMLSPLLAIGAGAGWFASKVQMNSPNLRIWVKRISGGLLVFIGMVMFFMTLI